MRRLALLGVALLIVTACDTGAGSTTTVGPTVQVTGTALAGPTCPVVGDPPDPGCADRPVAGAELLVADVEGTEIARTSTAQDGSFEITVPANRDYLLVALPVPGVLGTPEPIAFTASGEVVSLDVSYDTGIR